jgi:uncharacterized NAD(P)/FAD-binding protein YdhS
VEYQSIIDEAIKVDIICDNTINVELKSGNVVNGHRLILASGSVSVKVPDYLRRIQDCDRIIVDPFIKTGYERIKNIPKNSRILVIGTGLTGEEQANILLKSDHNNITLISRNGKRHFMYPLDQKNRHLTLEKIPDCFTAKNSEEFDNKWNQFMTYYLEKGYTHEDIFSAIQKNWTEIKKNIVDVSEKLFQWRRTLAVNSIGTSYEAAMFNNKAIKEGKLSIKKGHIKNVVQKNDILEVCLEDVNVICLEKYDYIINAVGRNIIQHPLWTHLLNKGIAQKHKGIGVNVNQYGQLIDSNGKSLDMIYVVGMPRSGDHAITHGYLGNTAFNVPQIRAHLYDTAKHILHNCFPK